MNATIDIPGDPALPGLVAMRTLGLARAVPSLGLDDDRPVELLLRAHKPGAHATVEARRGCRRLAVKAYATDPALEAKLYEAFAAAGLVSDAPVRVPPLLAWERDLRLLVVGWLEGPTAHELLKHGQGDRAGQLAACWLQHARSLRVTLGPPFGAAQMLRRARKWVGALRASDASLGAAAGTLAAMLERTEPKEDARRVVHGALHVRNIIDLGCGPGLIDWQRFGQGPAEVEAGTFLSSVWRVGLDGALAGEAARGKEAFLVRTAGLLDERALAWHLGAALLCRANRLLSRRKGDWPARAHALLGEAARVAKAAG